MAEIFIFSTFGKQKKKRKQVIAVSKKEGLKTLKQQEIYKCQL